MDQNQLDEFFMREALKEASKAFEAGEVPVGAVLVLEKKIISRGHNQVELLKDATAHAEMLAITSAAAELSNWRLLDTTLYCTLEPCLMCAGALISSRVKKIVYGAKDLRQGAHGSWIDVFDQNHPIHQVEIIPGVLEAESAELMSEFFRNLREKKKNAERDRASTTRIN